MAASMNDSSGVLRRVVSWKFTDVSEVFTDSTGRAMSKPSEIKTEVHVVTRYKCLTVYICTHRRTLLPIIRPNK
jgi:hypothetical protein